MSLLAALLALLLAPPEGRRIAAAPSWDTVYAWIAEPGPHCIRVRQTGSDRDTMSWVEELHIGGEWVTEWVGTRWPLGNPVPVDAMPGRADLPLGPTGMMIGWERIGAGVSVAVLPYALPDCPRPLFSRQMLGTVPR